MDKNEKLFERKIESFKKDWLAETGKEATEKMCWYFRKGMEKQCKEVKSRRMAMAGERFFDTDDVLLANDQHYPGRSEFKDCKTAFMRGFQTDLRVFQI